MNHDQFVRDIVRLHNVVRKKYGNVQPLTVDTTLNFIAQNYANHLAKKNTGLIHSSQTQEFNIKGLGENLYYFFSSNGRAPNPYEIIKGFVDEVKFYDFKEGKFSAEIGHFTQLVWASTTKLGFGMSQAVDGSWYVCINYTPCGNVSGSFIKNVLPSSKIKNRHNINFNPNRRSKSQHHIQKEIWTNKDTVISNKSCRNESYVKEISRMKKNSK